MRFPVVALAAFLIALTPGVFAQSKNARVLVLDEAGSQPAPTGQVAKPQAADPGEVAVYDPKRDAAADIRQALAVARKEGKHVLLEIGGDWCIWCKILDRYFDDHPDLLALRKANYVMVKVNYSPDNKNEAVLGRYPKAEGYPHLYVLNAGGKLVKSQGTGELEEGRGYNDGRMRAFLKENAPAR